MKWRKPLRDCSRERLSLRPVGEGDLGLLLAWRNHPDVRQHMYSRHIITPEEHGRWFARKSGEALSHLLLVERELEPVGFAQFSEAAGVRALEWGFYAAPGQPKGTGRQLGGICLDHAFGKLRVHKIVGHVHLSNQASIAMHAALGFIREGTLRQHAWHEGQFHDVAIFGLLSTEWPNQREHDHV